MSLKDSRIENAIRHVQLECRIAELDQRVDVPAVQRLVGALHDLDAGGHPRHLSMARWWQASDHGATKGKTRLETGLSADE